MPHLPSQPPLAIEDAYGNVWEADDTWTDLGWGYFAPKSSPVLAQARAHTSRVCDECLQPITSGSWYFAGEQYVRYGRATSIESRWHVNCALDQGYVAQIQDSDDPADFWIPSEEEALRADLQASLTRQGLEEPPDPVAWENFIKGIVASWDRANSRRVSPETTRAVQRGEKALTHTQVPAWRKDEEEGDLVPLWMIPVYEESTHGSHRANDSPGGTPGVAVVSAVPAVAVAALPQPGAGGVAGGVAGGGSLDAAGTQGGTGPPEEIQLAWW